MCQIGAFLPPALLDRPVSGSGLNESAAGGESPVLLRDQLDADRPTLLVFLRHLGCPFCREMVKDVRTAAETADGPAGRRRFPRVVFFHTVGPRRGARFFGRYWPAAPAVSDPGRAVYEALDFARAGVLQVFGPRVWPCFLRAARKGHRQGKFAGDLWAMPGLLLLAPDGRVLARHDFSHIGQHVDYARFVGTAVPDAPDPCESSAAGDGLAAYSPRSLAYSNTVSGSR